MTHHIAALVAAFATHPRSETGADAVSVFCHPDLGPVVEIDWDMFLQPPVGGAGTTFLWAEDARIASTDTEAFPPEMYDICDLRDSATIAREIFPRGPRVVHQSVEQAVAYYTEMIG